VQEKKSTNHAKPSLRSGADLKVKPMLGGRLRRKINCKQNACKFMNNVVYFVWRQIMATLQVRDIDERLYKTLKNAAKRQNRSISQEVVTMLQTHLNSVQKPMANATLEFLTLSGAWKDDRTAEEIITDIRSSRVQSNRFGEKDGIFD